MRKRKYYFGKNRRRFKYPYAVSNYPRMLEVWAKHNLLTLVAQRSLEHRLEEPTEHDTDLELLQSLLVSIRCARQHGGLPQLQEALKQYYAQCPVQQYRRSVLKKFHIPHWEVSVMGLVLPSE